MDTSPSLSIVLPVLNEAEGIAARLMGLQALKARGIEIIVVDGESRDDSVALATPLASRVVTSPPGRACQMNAGAQASHGKFLLFLHADTQLPSCAERMIAEALSGRARWGRFDIRLDGRHPMLRIVAMAMNARSRFTGIATGDQALFMTRQAFEAVDGFPEQPLMEDIELSKRLKRLSRPACLRSCVVSSARRWETHGVWRTILLMWCLRYRYWRGADSRDLAKEYRHAR